MSKFKLVFSIVLLILSIGSMNAQQSFYGGKFRIQSYTNNGDSYIIYDFDRKEAKMRAKYFAQNAYSQYKNWKSGKNVLLVTAGAFSTSFESNGIPVGLCVDNGKIVNRSMKSEMDGMVIVYNGGSQVGGIAIVDLDKGPVTVDGDDSYYPRTNTNDRRSFLNWGRDNGLTLFQTQLVYSEKKRNNFANLYFGKKAERRFLAICKKRGKVHHVVVDAPDDQYLNKAAKNAKEVLEYDGFYVMYILNLDTGGKNILKVNNGSYLQTIQEVSPIKKATNLLIYYTE